MSLVSFNPYEVSLQKNTTLEVNLTQNETSEQRVLPLVQIILRRFPYKDLFKNVSFTLRPDILRQFINLFAEEDRYYLPESERLFLAKIYKVIRFGFKRPRKDYERLFLPKIKKRRSTFHRLPFSRRQQILDSNLSSINDYMKVKQSVTDCNLILFVQQLNQLFNLQIPIEVDALDRSAQIIRTWFTIEENQEKINQITQLHLNKLNLTEIPKEIKYFRNLKILNLRDNNITYVQSNLFDNNLNLKSLLLNHNKLDYLPYGFLQKNIKLQRLNLSYNNLKVLPDCFLQANTALTFLNLSHNLLTDLPVNFLSNNIQMQFFYFRFNKFNQESFARRLEDFAFIEIIKH